MTTASRTKRLVAVLACTAGMLTLSSGVAHAAWGGLEAPAWSDSGEMRWQGDRDNTVMFIQSILNRFGYSTLAGGTCATSYAGSVDGVFGACTRSTVAAFQDGHWITADGIVAKNTWLQLQRGHTISAYHSTTACRGQDVITTSDCDFSSFHHPRPYVQTAAYKKFGWIVWSYWHSTANCWTSTSANAPNPCHTDFSPPSEPIYALLPDPL